ncbi:uncharacterized protein KY384_007591 [Bacidia gigantensis]|uniref:uncharacterized protein n=1 Tax=Bacidia gigantensis TaxID=2732470 RepID=UPI001D037FB8|nr:uncharacterized protein KY384_007591 [Bacidia gigantensis]KAG8527439.1 hypothetical protein KY384_007591 [Bacidia gigantensis]
MVPVARCYGCRRALVDAFIFTSGLPARSLTVVKLPRATRSKTVVKRFTTTQYRPQDARRLETSHDPDQIDEVGPTDTKQNKSQPWYLQVETPSRASSPLLDRQKLPELPENPPPLLSPLLNYASIDLGLDDLTLLDLRRLDPPPALGSNLIMLLGTVRSEKHLHVSAEQCCRWLKKEYRLSPHADGLIGRGELKLKLRRKARKAKMMSRVGAVETTDVDDGIRTGWICVHTRNVPDGEGSNLYKDLHEDFVGFKEESEGVNLVIQILTQEKREELDLEELWKKAAARHERKEARLSSNSEEHDHTKVPGLDRTSDASEDAPLASLDADTSRRHDSMAPGPTSPPEDAISNCVSLPANAIVDLSAAELQRTHNLQAHADSLKSMSVSEVKEALQSESSSFWSFVEDSWPLFPSAEEYKIRTQLLCQAYETGAHRNKITLSQTFRELQATFIDIPGSLYVRVLQRLLASPVAEADLNDVIDIVESMSARKGVDGLASLLCTFQNAILEVSAGAQSICLREDAFFQFRHLVTEIFGEPSVEDEVMMMYLCAGKGRWDEFWIVWRNFPSAMRPRTKPMYMAMFLLLAQRNHQAKAMQCLRECVPEMELEEPLVAMDSELAEAIQKRLASG